MLPARRNEIELRIEALQLEMETARLWAQLNFLFPDDMGATGTRNLSSTSSTEKESK